MISQNASINGFTLAYCSVMAAMLALTTPYTEGWRGAICLGLLLPCFLVGVAQVLYGRWKAGKDNVR